VCYAISGLNFAGCIGELLCTVPIPCILHLPISCMWAKNLCGWVSSHQGDEFLLFSPITWRQWAWPSAAHRGLELLAQRSRWLAFSIHDLPEAEMASSQKWFLRHGSLIIPILMQKVGGDDLLSSGYETINFENQSTRSWMLILSPLCTNK